MIKSKRKLNKKSLIASSLDYGTRLGGYRFFRDYDSLYVGPCAHGRYGIFDRRSTLSLTELRNWWGDESVDGYCCVNLPDSAVEVTA